MEIITLPDYLNLKGSPAIKVYDYSTSSECTKQMVSLKLNTISFLQEGHKEVFADNTSIAIEKSSFLLMKAGHCLMTETLSNSESDYKYRSILLFFSNDLLLDFIKKHQIKTNTNSKKESIHSFTYDTFLKTFVNGLIDICKLETNIQSTLLIVKFEELMLYLVATKGVQFLHSLISHHNSKTQHFIDVVETNKLNKLSLKELSFLSNMSISTFKREFDKHFQSSPSKWFQEKRLEHAAYLLKSESKRPSDIFETVGYESLSNFIQAFKTKYTVTPKQYQQD